MRSAKWFFAGGSPVAIIAVVALMLAAPTAHAQTTSQSVNCQPGQTCQSPTVSSDGTSGFAAASAAPTTDVLTASAGFPPLSCTKYGGVLGFTVPNRSKVITLTVVGSVVRMGTGTLKICFGSPTPFATKNGTTSKFYSPDNQYEGLLPSCTGGSEPCIASQVRESDGSVVSTIDAPAGDPYISY